MPWPLNRPKKVFTVLGRGPPKLPLLGFGFELWDVGAGDLAEGVVKSFQAFVALCVAGGTSFLETNAAATAIACGSIPDEFDTSAIQRADKLHQRVHIAANNAIAGFHPLNCRQGEPRLFGKLPLIDSGKRSGGS